MRFRRFLSPRIVVGAVCVVVLVAVFGGTFIPPESGLLPPPSGAADGATDTTTTTIDYSKNTLPVVAGDELAAPLDETGASVIFGVVQGPEVLLPGAVVRLERLVGDQVQRIDVATAADGTFRAEGIPGGRYRVRAWLAPSYTQAEPEIFFLRDGDERELTLRTEQLDETVVRASTRPSAPFVGEGVNIAVLVADRVVDADGVARTQPLPGVPVALSVSGLSAVDPGVVRGTDGSGVAVFEFSCEKVGTVTATARVGAAAEPAPTNPDDPDPDNPGDATDTTQADSAPQPDVIDEVVSIEIPPCAPIPTTTTTTTVDDDSQETTTTTEG